MGHDPAAGVERRAVVLPALLLAGAALVGRPPPAWADQATVYASLDEPGARRLLDVYTRTTGTPVRLAVLGARAALGRLEAERGSPRSDVWLGASIESHVVAKAQGLTQPYVPASAREIPSRYRDRDSYWTGFCASPLALGVNPRVLRDRGADLPVAWEDLLVPELRGQLLFPNPLVTDTGYVVVATLVQLWGEDRAFVFLRKLHRNVAAYSPSETAPARVVATGQAAVAIQLTPELLRLGDEGATIRIVFPKDGVGFEALAVSIARGAPYFDAGRRLVDWLLSLDGQNAITGAKTYLVPVHPRARPTRGLPALDQIPLIEYDAIWAGQNRKRLLDRWAAEIR